MPSTVLTFVTNLRDADQQQRQRLLLTTLTAACWAEHAIGAGEGSDDVLMVTLGTGIGGGAVLGGRLVEGAHGFAGEIGHMVIDPQAHRARVGKRAAGSASPRGAPWAGWAGKRLKRGSSAPLSGWQEATRRRCGVNTSPQRRSTGTPRPSR